MQQLEGGSQGKSDRAAVYLGCQTNAWRIPHGDHAAFLHALGRIQSFGFDGFETGFVNLPGITRTQIEHSGLLFFAAHIFLLEYDPQTLIAPPDLIHRVADEAAQLGAGGLILSGGSNESDVGRKAEALNRTAVYCRERGLGLAYHNHPHEFQHGGAEITRLLGETQAEVELVLDAGHVHVTGGDALAFFEEHYRRISALHLRDFAGPDQVPLGSGSLDLNAWAEAIARLGWSGWALAEEERPNDGRPGDEAVGPAATSLRRTFRAAGTSV